MSDGVKSFGGVWATSGEEGRVWEGFFLESVDGIAGGVKLPKQIFEQINSSKHRGEEDCNSKFSKLSRSVINLCHLAQILSHGYASVTEYPKPSPISSLMLTFVTIETHLPIRKFLKMTVTE